MSLKEKFADAINLKVFISSKCPNVFLLERVLKILMKMIQRHPDEMHDNEAFEDDEGIAESGM